jgi:hypothetical protein
MKQMNDVVMKVCTVCEQVLDPAQLNMEDPIKEYTEEPCWQCKQHIKQGDFLFVLISDKSDENRINRLHKTWVVDRQEVLNEFGSLDEFKGEQVVFITETDAIKVGLLEERVTDKETGIPLSQLQEEEEEDPVVGKSTIIKP